MSQSVRIESIEPALRLREVGVGERATDRPPEATRLERRRPVRPPEREDGEARLRLLVLGIEAQRAEDTTRIEGAEVIRAVTLAEARAALDERPDALVLHVASGTGMALAQLVRELPIVGVPRVAVVDGAVYGGCALELGADAVIALRAGEPLRGALTRAARVCRAMTERGPSSSASPRGYALLLETHRRLLAQTVEARLGRAMVVHDLRSPLGTLRGVLAETIDQGIDPRVSAIMERSIAQLASLVDRLEALDGDAPLHEERLDVAEVARGVADQLRLDPAAPARELTVGGAPTARWVGDRRLLERVITNLVTNALRHARERVELRVDARGGAVRIAVLDDGPGLPASIRHELFRRYVRSPHGGRLGLGLAIVKGAVDRFEGRVAAYDRGELGGPGGACFVVRLPRR